VSAAKKRMSRRDLADKCEWEGGVYAAIEYGIKHDDVPLIISHAWKKAEDLFDELSPLLDEISAYLDVDVDEEEP
jgi:hypothetical protein